MSNPNTMHESFKIDDNEYFYARCKGLLHAGGVYMGYCYIEDNEVFWHVKDTEGNIFETPEMPIDDISSKVKI
jgi:hypothetical protein